MSTLQPGRVIIAVLLLAGLFFGLTRAGWVIAEAPGLAGGSVEHVVNGQRASPAVGALIAVVLAAALAAAITRGWLRTAIAVIAAICAAGTGMSMVPVLLDPVAASRAEIAAQTGVFGQSLTAELTPWPYVALTVVVALTAACAVLALIARRVPVRGSDRFSRAGAGPRAHRNEVAASVQRPEHDGSERSDAADWDELTRGEDPS